MDTIEALSILSGALACLMAYLSIRLSRSAHPAADNMSSGKSAIVTLDGRPLHLERLRPVDRKKLIIALERLA